MKQRSRSVIYLTMLVLAVGGGNLWWTSRVSTENSRSWCSVITVIAAPGPPPATARQRAIVAALERQYTRLGC